MITRHTECTTERTERKAGGEGHTLLESLLTPENRGEHCRLFSRVTLEAHCSLGYHEHHGESETYYILAGHGCYNDNGTLVDVGPGDVTHTPSGSGHALANTGDTPLEFVALILA